VIAQWSDGERGVLDWTRLVNKGHAADRTA
jgi:hypothetical protein